jgi:NAD(P)H-dependent flavin oxidoreductase YrpB (nitropropane dioxygenase family)
MSITTPLTQLLGIQRPIMLAGMNVAAGPELAAAVTNAGGLGVIGGVGYTPKVLRKQLETLKKNLNDKKAPFGVDLLLPKVGEGARATNYDYTKGHLEELVDIIIESGASLFVCAVGVPPKHVVEKFHANGIPVMNMIGHPKHVKYALGVGCDIICAQGGEGGGHTGEVATSILIPAVVDLCKGKKSPLTGGPVHVVAAGGIYDGRGLAMALALGADAAWIGTRFICAKEAGAPPRHKKGVLATGYSDTHRTLIYTGRPLRIKKSKYSMNWEENRAADIKRLTSSGVIPYEQDVKDNEAEEKEWTQEEMMDAYPMLMGTCAAAVTEILPAKTIMDDMMSTAVSIIQANNRLVSRL